ncbi:MAG: class I SAM-dependent methyltransferase [Chloroflexi bacterium]|nr:class I SAM-dependent methyltransferase [Chloroflexota bacterium]
MKIFGKRWRKAQQAENHVWQAEPSLQPLTDSQRDSNLGRVCKYTGLPANTLENMRVLEIGGPVIERAFDNPGTAPKLVLDPLLGFTRAVGRERASRRIRGVGEYLPLPDGSFDLCWCANTIDHTSSPEAVMGEIRRVLKDGAILVISCNLFPGWTRPFFRLFDFVDTPHPHHYTLPMFRRLLEERFVVQRQTVETEGRHTGFAAHPGRLIPRLLGVRYYYFRCLPKK